MTSLPTLKEGDTGPNVYALQYLLRHRGGNLDADGTFGPQTKSMVEQFQYWNGLDINGVAGPETLSAMFDSVGLESHNEAVWAVQYLMNHVHGYTEVDVDGTLGPMSHAAVKDFQARKGLDADGVVGPQGWTALFSSP
jgi:peptidoglycan hydrolase-like protein with peptidoglycan-binding domain